MKRPILIILLIILLVGTGYYAFINLFPTTTASTTAVVVDNPAQLLDRLKNTEQAYKEMMDSIDMLNFSLRTKVTKTQTALAAVKKENGSLKQTINDLLNIHNTTTDTTQKLENCDSLAATIQELVMLDITKDSIYENLSADLQQQVSLKDSVIVIQQGQYDSLQVSYQKSLEQQQELLHENTRLQKAVKKQRKGKGFLGAVLVAVSSLFVFHTLK